MTIPRPEDSPTLPAVPFLAEAFGRGHSSVSELCRRAVSGEADVLPLTVWRIGRSYVIATNELRRLLALDDETAPDVSDAVSTTSTTIAAVLPAVPANGDTRGTRSAFPA